MSTTDVKLFFTINAEGEFEVGTDKDESEERFNDNIQTGGARITYAVEITDVELPDEPRTIRVSMKGATKERNVEGPVRAGSGWAFSSVED